jgi:hypothetical protein
MMGFHTGSKDPYSDPANTLAYAEEDFKDPKSIISWPATGSG